MRAGFGRVTARIQGIGGRWRNWSELTARSEGTNQPANAQIGQKANSQAWGLCELLDSRDIIAILRPCWDLDG